MSSPIYLFRIERLREDRYRARNMNSYGVWSPPNSLGSNETWIPEGSYSPPYYYCNGSSITPCSQLPSEAMHYSTISMYYCAGHFYLVDCDASTTQIGDGLDYGQYGSANFEASTSDTLDDSHPWQRLHFELNENDFSSVACYAGEWTRLRYQRTDQRWARRLLPSTYHAEQVTTTDDRTYGGLNGELPVILALLAFSVKSDYVDAYFTDRRNFNGMFNVGHKLGPGREDYRGMVVTVWSWPPHSNDAKLSTYEAGGWGNLFP